MNLGYFHKTLKSPVIKTKSGFVKRILRYKYVYILFSPLILYHIIFSYFPMYGAILAFKDFDYSKGILFSPWTQMNGLLHFYDIFSDRGFWQPFFNTIIISFGRIIFEFPIPIVLALLFNEIRGLKIKRYIQTVLTFPHFISWIVVVGIFSNLLSDTGVLNEIIVLLGGQKVNLLTQSSTFRGLLFATDSWKEAGWGTIIYLAAIAGINEELYEAAIVDGAKRFQIMRYITFPALKSIIGLLLILEVGYTMSAGFDQIFNMYNAAVYDVADILDTFIFRRSFTGAIDFATATAIGLFRSVISLTLLFFANSLSKKISNQSIF